MRLPSVLATGCGWEAVPKAKTRQEEAGSLLGEQGVQGRRTKGKTRVLNKKHKNTEATSPFCPQRKSCPLQRVLRCVARRGRPKQEPSESPNPRGTEAKVVPVENGEGDLTPYLRRISPPEAT